MSQEEGVVLHHRLGALEGGAVADHPEAVPPLPIEEVPVEAAPDLVHRPAGVKVAEKFFFKKI